MCGLSASRTAHTGGIPRSIPAMARERRARTQPNDAPLAGREQGPSQPSAWWRPDPRNEPEQARKLTPCEAVHSWRRLGVPSRGHHGHQPRNCAARTRARVQATKALFHRPDELGVYDAHPIEVQAHDVRLRWRRDEPVRGAQQSPTHSQRLEGRCDQRVLTADVKAQRKRRSRSMRFPPPSMVRMTLGWPVGKPMICRGRELAVTAISSRGAFRFLDLQVETFM